VFHTPDRSYFCPPLTFSELGDPPLRFLLDASGKVQKISASYGATTLPSGDALTKAALAAVANFDHIAENIGALVVGTPGVE
jgi:hypothetical protein